MIYKLFTKCKDKVYLEAVIRKIFIDFTFVYNGIKDNFYVEIETTSELKIEQLCKDICRISGEESIRVKQANSQEFLILKTGQIKCC